MSRSELPASIPRFHRVRQHFEGQPAEADIATSVERELQTMDRLQAGRMTPGASVAVAVGSRGIADIVRVVAALVEGLKRRGCEPFLVPAMGSHGGATPAGQEATLARLGITEEAVGAPIRSQSAVLEVARTDSGLPVFADRLAVSADLIIPVNRITTHTNFSARVESGLLKMLAVGLGKRPAAESAHRAASGRGLGKVILEVGHKALAALSVPFGLAIVENARSQVARIAAIPGESLEAGEMELLEEAKALKPSLPFEFLHLLVVDRMGKNISGTGMDTKVIGRMLQTGEAEPVTPHFLRIYVRDLSPETGGNAHGMGLADFISHRLAEKIDPEATLANGLSACAPQRGKRPPVVSSDQEAIALGLSTSGCDDPSQARIVRIASTRELERLWISAPLCEEAEQAGLTIESDVSPPFFDAAGDLSASL